MKNNKKAQNKKNKKIIITPKVIRDFFWVLSIIIIFGGIICLTRNFIPAKNSLNKLRILKRQVATTMVNMKSWEEINQNLEYKKSLTEFNIENNPF